MNKNANPLVTVAMPLYNSGNTMMKSIQSIVNQDYDNIEILLINDGSTDNTGMMCKSFSNEFSFIRTIEIEHGGVSEARNYAINSANGDYIAFVDSDDLVATNYISSLMNLAINNLSSFPICGIELRDAKDNSVIEQRTYPNDKKLRPNSEFVELYKAGLLSSACNKVYRVQSLKAGLVKFNTEISTGEDLLFNLRYLRECRGFIVDSNPLYIYNVSSSGTLHTKHDKSRFSEIKTMASALIASAKHFKCGKDAMNIIALKILDEYMHSFRLFCLSNYDTMGNRKFLSDIMKTDEFKFAFKALGNSNESAAYKNVLRLKNPHLLMKYFSRNK